MPAAKLWFTSDLHLNCTGVLSDGWGRRPHTDVAAHDAWVALTINKHVSQRDRLVILGDNAFARNAVEQAGILRKFFKAVECKNLTFIRGNHDYPGALACLGRECCDYATVPWNGVKFFCCHYPLLTWPDSHHGSICCYGHTHAAFEAEFDSLMPQRRSLDVGLDNAVRVLGEYRPFEAGEIVELLKDRKGSFPVTARTVGERK
jgi:calcineurin-like phosphoesterase family protein